MSQAKRKSKGQMKLLIINNENNIYKGKPCYTIEQSITGRKPLSNRSEIEGASARKPLDAP